MLSALFGPACRRQVRRYLVLARYVGALHVTKLLFGFAFRGASHVI